MVVVGRGRLVGVRLHDGVDFVAVVSFVSKVRAYRHTGARENGERVAVLAGQLNVNVGVGDVGHGLPFGLAEFNVMALLSQIVAAIWLFGLVALNGVT